MLALSLLLALVAYFSYAIYLGINIEDYWSKFLVYIFGPLLVLFAYLAIKVDCILMGRNKGKVVQYVG